MSNENYSEDTSIDNQIADMPDEQLNEYMLSLNSQTDEGTTSEEEEDYDESVEQDEAGDEQSDNLDTDDDTESEDQDEDGDEADESEAAPEGLDRVLAPFKANGKMIQVDNVDDAISLMQMGANYSQKMHSLKPHLKTIRMLEQQNVMDEGVLHTLIDAHKGSPEAIRKLIVDAGIDPTDLLDIDPEQPLEYSPKDYAITDTQYEFHNAVEELKGSEFYDTTMDAISGWDERSRVAMYENPSILKGLHAVIADNHFEKIQSHLGTLRTLGKVPAGMTDVDAFGMAAQMLEERGELGAAPNKQERNQPKRDVALVDRKRAVAPAKGRRTAPKATGMDLDFASMTDEEFAKAYDAGLYKQLSQ